VRLNTYPSDYEKGKARGQTLFPQQPGRWDGITAKPTFHTDWLFTNIRSPPSISVYWMKGRPFEVWGFSFAKGRPFKSVYWTKVPGSVWTFVANRPSNGRYRALFRRKPAVKRSIPCTQDSENWNRGEISQKVGAAVWELYTSTGRTIQNERQTWFRSFTFRLGIWNETPNLKGGEVSFFWKFGLSRSWNPKLESRDFHPIHAIKTVVDIGRLRERKR